MASYYDLVLALIPLTLLGVSGVLLGAGLGLTVAVPAGAAVAAGIVGHAMFVKGPTTVDAPTPRGHGRTPTAD